MRILFLAASCAALTACGGNTVDSTHMVLEDSSINDDGKVVEFYTNAPVLGEFEAKATAFNNAIAAKAGITAEEYKELSYSKKEKLFDEKTYDSYMYEGALPESFAVGTPIVSFDQEFNLNNGLYWHLRYAPDWSEAKLKYNVGEMGKGQMGHLWGSVDVEITSNGSQWLVEFEKFMRKDHNGRSFESTENKASVMIWPDGRIRFEFNTDDYYAGKGSPKNVKATRDTVCTAKDYRKQPVKCGDGKELDTDLVEELVDALNNKDLDAMRRDWIYALRQASSN